MVGECQPSSDGEETVRGLALRLSARSHPGFSTRRDVLIRRMLTLSCGAIVFKLANRECASVKSYCFGTSANVG